MDWKTWVAVGLSVIGLILWQVFYASKLPPPPPPPLPPAVVAKDGEPVGSGEVPAPRDAGAQVPAPVPQTAVSMVPAKSEKLSAKDADYVFNNDTGGIEEVILLLHLADNRESVFLNRDKAMPIGALGTKPGESLGGFEMDADPQKKQVVFTKKDADGLVIRKKFSLPESEEPRDKFTVLLELEFENTGAVPLQRLGYFLGVGSAQPVHSADLPLYTRFDWYREGKMQSIDVNWFNPSSVPLLGIPLRDAQPLYTETADKIAWAAVSGQYFCTVVSTKTAVGTSVWANRFELKGVPSAHVYGIRGGLGLAGFELQAGQKKAEKFHIYAGPKELRNLSALGGGEDAILNFGWFSFVSVFLLWAMNSLYSLLGNYAAAIIVLTLCIKTVLWPIQNRATNSMRRMSLLSPKMTELREKYKDNPQKMNEELMKLYKDYGINPFSGCVPLLIQIPIFFGFYSMLGVAIELRNASFLWINDLSQPDTIGYLYGFPINLLPLVMAGTMIWQMALTPKTGDAVQQRIFYFMPVIFLVFCYNFASALALYWTTQNLFSIVQLYLTRNKPLPTLEKVSVTAKKMKRKG